MALLWHSLVVSNARILPLVDLVGDDLWPMATARTSDVVLKGRPWTAISCAA